MPRPIPGEQRSVPLIILIAAVALFIAGVLTAVTFWNRADFAFPGNPVFPPEGPGTEPPPGNAVEPFWPEAPYIARPLHVRGIYVNFSTLGEGRFSELIELIHNTEINAMVIDIKDDQGLLTYARTQVPWAVDAGAPGGLIEDPVEFMAQLAEHQIYPIARIVAFKDNLMAQHRPDLAILSNSGELWRDGGRQYWLDPYNQEAWKYIVALAREAAELGFREIQFDYVRLPSDGNLRDIVYPARDDTPVNMIIPLFLRYAKASLARYDVEVSADVFGLVTSDPTGMGIGQHLESMAAELDLICPMIYPSHYGPGNLGLADPDSAPYETVYRSIDDALQRLDRAGLNTAIRPWLQSFTIRHLYRAEEIRAQIEAAERLGIHEFLLWNNGNFYNRAALRDADKE